MNRDQWFVLSMGSILLSIFLFEITGSYCNPLVLNNEQMTACFMRRYTFSILAIIFQFIGWFFIISGFLEFKKHK